MNWLAPATGELACDGEDALQLLPEGETPQHLQSIIGETRDVAAIAKLLRQTVRLGTPATARHASIKRPLD